MLKFSQLLKFSYTFILARFLRCVSAALALFRAFLLICYFFDLVALSLCAGADFQLCIFSASALSA